MNKTKRSVLTIMLAMTLSDAVQAQCVAQKQLTGFWNADDGGTYLIRVVEGSVWWIGKSADGGKLFTNVFRGVINGNTIDGEWADLSSSAHESATGGHGFLQLKIDGAIGSGVHGLEKVGSTGAPFGARIWSQPCHDTN